MINQEKMLELIELSVNIPLGKTMHSEEEIECIKKKQEQFKKIENATVEASNGLVQKIIEAKLDLRDGKEFSALQNVMQGLFFKEALSKIKWARLKLSGEIYLECYDLGLTKATIHYGEKENYFLYDLIHGRKPETEEIGRDLMYIIPRLICTTNMGIMKAYLRDGKPEKVLEIVKNIAPYSNLLPKQLQSDMCRYLAAALIKTNSPKEKIKTALKCFEQVKMELIKNNSAYEDINLSQVVKGHTASIYIQGGDLETGLSMIEGIEVKPFKEHWMLKSLHPYEKIYWVARNLFGETDKAMLLKKTLYVMGFLLNEQDYNAARNAFVHLVKNREIERRNPTVEILYKSSCLINRKDEQDKSIMAGV